MFTRATSKNVGQSLVTSLLGMLVGSATRGSSSGEAVLLEILVAVLEILVAMSLLGPKWAWASNLVTSSKRVY